jgi:hypothetical protein
MFSRLYPADKRCTDLWIALQISENFHYRKGSTNDGSAGASASAFRASVFPFIETVCSAANSSLSYMFYLCHHSA